MRYHELKHHHEEDFIQRHIGPAAHDIEAMLKIIGFDSLDRMTDAILPKASICQKRWRFARLPLKIVCCT